MAGFCEVAAAVGLAFICGGNDAPAPNPVDQLGNSSGGVYDFRSAPPPMPKPVVVKPDVIPGQLTVSGPVDFRALTVGQSQQQEISLSNSGGENLSISVVELSAPPSFSMSANCSILAPQHVCKIPVSFAPTGAGSFKGKVLIGWNGQFTTVAVSGIAFAEPAPVVQKKQVKTPKPKRKKRKAGPTEGEIRASLILQARRRTGWVEVAAVDPQFGATLDGLGSNTAVAQDVISTLKLQDSEYPHKSKTSSLPVDNQRIVTTDRYITGILEVGINSQVSGDAGGQIVIQVSRDVFGYHESKPLIPKGSRIVCNYESLEVQGQSRLPVICKRVLRAEDRAELWDINAPAGDVMGRAGIPGEVDNRIWERYGSAAIISAIAAVSAAASTTAGTDSTLGAAGTQLSDNLGEITAKVLEQTVNLAPILTVSQGQRVVIMPRTDWILKEPEIVSAN